MIEHMLPIAIIGLYTAGVSLYIRSKVLTIELKLEEAEGKIRAQNTCIKKLQERIMKFEN